MNLSPQLVSVSPLDTFVLGAVHLNEHFTVIASSGVDTSSLPEKVRVVSFDPEHESLMVKVAEEVARLGGAQFTAHESIPDTVSSVQCTTCDRPVDIEHFAPLFDQLPVVSYGSHMDSVKGEAWRFGRLEDIFRELTYSYFHAHLLKDSLSYYFLEEYDLFELKTLEKIIDRHLEILQKTYGNHPSLESLRKQAENWKKIFFAEWWFQLYRSGTFQLPASENQSSWIKERILDVDLPSYSDHQREKFLADAKEMFQRRVAIDRTPLKDLIGGMLSGEPLSVLLEFEISPGSLCSNLLNKWYLKGERSEFDHAERLGKFSFSVRMITLMESYQKKSERPNPVYAQRAREICAWLGDKIRKEIASVGEDRFYRNLVYYHRIKDFEIPRYQKMVKDLLTP